jgi:toxin ParE1/3/4
MKPYRFHPDARAEANAAFEYYAARSPTAALKLDDELRAAYNSLQKYPRMYAEYLHGTRRALLGRFPYFVVYRELPGKIEILAVAHAKRRPGYWKKRVKN